MIPIDEVKNKLPKLSDEELRDVAEFISKLLQDRKMINKDAIVELLSTLHYIEL